MYRTSEWQEVGTTRMHEQTRAIHNDSRRKHAIGYACWHMFLECKGMGVQRGVTLHGWEWGALGTTRLDYVRVWPWLMACANMDQYA